MGELRGLSRWRTRYQGIGLDESLISHVTEKSGMIIVQVERFMRLLSSVVQQVYLSEDPSIIFDDVKSSFCSISDEQSSTFSPSAIPSIYYCRQ